jgi:hypothetical protein
MALLVLSLAPDDFAETTPAMYAVEGALVGGAVGRRRRTGNDMIPTTSPQPTLYVVGAGVFAGIGRGFPLSASKTSPALPLEPSAQAQPEQDVPTAR